MNFSTVHPNQLPKLKETVSAAGHAEFLMFQTNPVSLRRLATHSLKIAYNHKFIQLTPSKCVRDVAILRPQCNRRAEGCCTCLDTEFSNRQGAYDPGPASQEETLHGRAAAEANRCKIRG